MSGGQAKLDMNKNNKIDKEDFKILKKKKQAYLSAQISYDL